jgi:hypothetical protein
MALRKSKGVDSTGFNSPVGMPGVHWGEAGRVPGELMVQDVALSQEIEVRMIREIDRGVFVGTPKTVLTIPSLSFPSSSRSK